MGQEKQKTKQSPWNRINMLKGEVRTQTKPNMLSAKLVQSYPTLGAHELLCPPGSSVHGILQVRILEWIAISFSSGLPDPGIKPWSPALQADALPSCRIPLYNEKSYVWVLLEVIILVEIIFLHRRGELYLMSPSKNGSSRGEACPFPHSLVTFTHWL